MPTLERITPAAFAPLPCRPAGPALITDRLTLWHLTPDDWEFYDALLADPEVRRWDGQGRGTRFGRRLYFEADLSLSARARRAERDGRPTADATFVVRLRGYGEDGTPGAPVGLISTCLADARRRRAEIGFSLARAHWGRGYATEAARAVAARLFDGPAGLRELCAVCHAGNVASGRVLAKIGMRPSPPPPLSVVPREFGPSWLFTVVVRDPERELCHYRLTAEEWREGV
jgi:RimJ/RimL family protein N-acetyltransferase